MPAAARERALCPPRTRLAAMALVLQLCTSLGLLQPNATLCEGVYSTNCQCVCVPEGMRICCSGNASPDDVVRLLTEELSGKPKISVLEISQTHWGDEFPPQLFTDVRPKVHKVVLNHNGLSVLPAAVFRGLQDTVLLRISDNLLTDVPSAALQDLPQLRTLAVTANRIGRLARDQLARLGRLSYLSLAKNRLRALEPGALPASIRHLSLHDNQLESLNGTLRNLVKMRWLFISKNRLASLRDELPDGDRLNTLIANENQLTELDGLQNASALKMVKLHANRISSLGRLRLLRLRGLELSSNRISQATPEEFAGLPELQEVTLASNLLTEVGPILDVLPRLVKLDLSDNQLTTVGSLASRRKQGEGATERAKSHPLGQLYVRGNRLTSLGELDLPKLRVLDLSDNQLTQVSASNFAGLPSLRELMLSGNQLEEVGLLLEVLPSLTRADFSDNALTSVTPLRSQEELPHEDKRQLMHLETLLLNNNSLSTLHVSLHRVPSLCVLDVRDNAISSLQWHSHDAWQCHRHRSKLRLRGNPVRCEDEAVRRSLTWAAQHFKLDVPVCDGLVEP